MSKAISLSELQALIDENSQKIAYLQSMNKQASAQDANLQSYENAQQRADDALVPHGKRAGPPLLGEPVGAYKRRLAGEVQKHTTKWRDFPLGGVRADAFEAQIEAAIYQDAMSTRPQCIIGTQISDILDVTRTRYLITRPGDWLHG